MSAEISSCPTCNATAVRTRTDSNRGGSANASSGSELLHNVAWSHSRRYFVGSCILLTKLSSLLAFLSPEVSQMFALLPPLMRVPASPFTVSSCSGAPWASSAWSVPRLWPHAVGASLTPPRTSRQTARQYLHCCRLGVHGLCCCWQHGLHFRHLWASPPVDHVSVYLLR